LKSRRYNYYGYFFKRTILIRLIIAREAAFQVSETRTACSVARDYYDLLYFLKQSFSSIEIIDIKMMIL